MATPRRAYLHVGLDDGSGDVVGDALAAHAHALLDLRVRRPADQGATFRAVIDVLEAHDDWGYERDEVDGAWYDLVGRARRGRDTIVLSEPLLSGASTDRARAVVASLDGFDVHAVVTARPPQPWSTTAGPAHDLTEVLPRWADALGAADRVHVLLGDPATTWRSLGRGAGFGTASLKVAPSSATPGPVDPAVAAAWREVLGSSSYDVVGDPALLESGTPTCDTLAEACDALAEARHELTLLRRRTSDLEERLAKVEKKRRKLKRRLAELD